MSLMSGAIFFSFLASLLICMALIPVLTVTAGRLHILDIPDERKVHKEPIARIGGVALAIGVISAILLWAPKDKLIIASIIGGIIILCFGVWDDKANLGYKTKLFGQFLAASIIVGLGQVTLTSLPFMSEYTLPQIISIPLTIIILIGSTNAINLSDGLDGLAGGLSLLSLAGMSCLAYLVHDQSVLLMIVPVIGGLIGFLRFNTYPARIFMGDGGSQFLGFFLGISAIVLTDVGRSPYSPLLALLLLGLPIIDTLCVMTHRLVEGRSPFSPDKNHFHHKLLHAGFLHYEAVIIIYSIQVGMVLLAYLLRWSHDLTLLLVYLSITLSIVAFYFFADKGDRPWLKLGGGIRMGPSIVNRLEQWEWLKLVPHRLLQTAVPLYLILSVFLPIQISNDIALLCAGLSLALLLGFWFFPFLRYYLIRFGLYVGTTFVMYFGELQFMATPRSLQIWQHFLFGIFALLVVLAIRFDHKHRFQTTPLDYLIVSLALIFPWLPEMWEGSIFLGVLTAKIIVFFFAIELLLNTKNQRPIYLEMLTLWIFAMLAIRSWL